METNTETENIEKKIEELEEPYQDREVLTALYRIRGLSLREVGSELDCSHITINNWMERLGIERRRSGPETKDGPWQDEETLRRLYHDEELSERRVADRLGCSKALVRNWMDKLGVERRDQAEALREAHRVEYAGYGITPKGYKRWHAYHEGDVDYVQVHQLAAIADGADPHDVFGDNRLVCHHVTGHKLINIPRMIDVIDTEDHTFLHMSGSWEMNDEGFPILSVSTTDNANS